MKCYHICWLSRCLDTLTFPRLSGSQVPRPRGSLRGACKASNTSLEVKSHQVGYQVASPLRRPLTRPDSPHHLCQVQLHSCLPLPSLSSCRHLGLPPVFHSGTLERFHLIASIIYTTVSSSLHPAPETSFYPLWTWVGHPGLTQTVQPRLQASHMVAFSQPLPPLF